MEEQRLAKVASGYGIGRLERHIFLCADQTNPKCFDKERSNQVWEHLKKRVAGLAGSGRIVFRTKANCLRICERGPIAVVYPEGTWYHSVTEEVVDRIVEEHLTQGRPVAEYVIVTDPLVPKDAVLLPEKDGEGE